MKKTDTDYNYTQLDRDYWGKWQSRGTPRRHMIAVRLPAGLHAALNIACELENVSQGVFFQKLIEDTYSEYVTKARRIDLTGIDAYLDVHYLFRISGEAHSMLMELAEASGLTKSQTIRSLLCLGLDKYSDYLIQHGKQD